MTKKLKSTKKPMLKKVLELQQLEVEMEILRNQIDEIKEGLFEKHGGQVFAYDVTDEGLAYDDEDKTPIKYLRLTLKDNIKEMQEKGFCFTAAKIYEYSVKVENMQRKPKEMK